MNLRESGLESIGQTPPVFAPEFRGKVCDPLVDRKGWIPIQ